MAITELSDRVDGRKTGLSVQGYPLRKIVERVNGIHVLSCGHRLPRPADAADYDLRKSRRCVECRSTLAAPDAAQLHGLAATGLTEQARQLVKKWHQDLILARAERDSTLGQAVSYLPGLADRIASFAAEAATQGQSVGIERAIEVCTDFYERWQRLRAEVPSVDKQSWNRFSHIKNAAHEIRSALERLNPDTHYLNRVRNEARESGIAEGVAQVWEGAIRALSTKKQLTPPEAVVKKAMDEAATAALEQAAQNRPKIICLCGSTRFVQTWIDEYQRLSDEGNIVLTVARMPPRPNLQHDEPELKRKLDGLHFHKIALADEVFILNVGGYIGESTTREIEHAMNLKKTIRWLEQPIAAIGDDKA